MKRLRMTLSAGILSALLVGAFGCSGCGPKKVRLEGAGSSLVDPMMGEWKTVYGKAKDVQIDYKPDGSGDGIKSLIKGDVDFACSDAYLNEKETQDAQASGGEVLHIPLCMAGVVAIYNLGFDADLVFSGEVLAGIFQGEITKWDDDKILALQTDEVKKMITDEARKNMPPEFKITPVVRGDSSGTTYIFTDYLSKATKVWKTPASKTINQPKNGVAGQKTPGVTSEVKKTVGSIGYCEVTYAKQSQLKFGKIRNAAGHDVSADDKNITAAASSLEVPDDLKYSIVNMPGENAYPIAGTVWAIVYVKQTRSNAVPLAEFLTWVTSDEGQKLCEAKSYARLPDAVVKKIEGKIKQIQAK